MRVLAVNAGSSSLKLSLIADDDTTVWEHELHDGAPDIDPGQLDALLSGKLSEQDVIAHRVVHGGSRFRAAAVIDAKVLAELDDLTALAPLHQPKSLTAINSLSVVLPGHTAVACFDTAFHQTIPEAAVTYALPIAWRQRWAIRRYGFHGLSHAWVARRAEELLGARSSRIVSCHLGAGASLCAIRDGRSVDTTMGFTPLDGLVMATRSGSVDPGLLLWLQEQAGVSETEMAHALEHESGLLGLAGSADMREVLNRAAAGDQAATLARDVYLHRLRTSVGAMVAAMDGVDALVFTGGVGERSAEVRRRCADGLRSFGLELDAAANCAADEDADVSRDGSAVRILRLRAREDLEMARQTRTRLARPAER